MSSRPVWLTRRPEVWVLTALSAALRFWHLYVPNAVVFDELHYEHFAGNYLTHAYMFDVHPPLGRMMFAALAWLLHVPAATLVATMPGPAPAMRILPATLGTILVPLVWLMLRQLGASRRVATLGAIGILLDNALVTISRYILVDIFLVVFGVAAINCYLAARARAGRARWWFLIASAFLAGCALSVKWTGASALATILAAWFVEALLRRDWARAESLRLRIGEGLLFTAVPAIVYLAAFAVQFSVLSHTGPGDAFMSIQFRMQQPGSPQYDPHAPKLSFWTKLAEVHHAIRYGNGELQNVTHPASSRWYTWPIMKHPVGLWERAGAKDGSHTMIILLGNPLVWWAGLAGFFAGLLALALKRRAGYEFGLSLLLFCAIMNFAPFAGIKRIMYLYHYMFALTVVVALAAFAGGVLTGEMRDGERAPWVFPSRRSAAVYAGIVLLLAIGFVYFSPFTYGFTQSGAAWDLRFRVLHPF
jgi:dolichyl-phosphate-mannose-protein mannosyltransferase